MDRLGLVVSVLAVAGSVLVCGCADKKYPRCGAFEFGDLASPPKIVDGDADPEACGEQLVGGSQGALEVEPTDATDCALRALEEGRPFRLRFDRGVTGDAETTRAEVFGDGDGLALLWQDIDMDLAGTFEARVIQLDVEQAIACRSVDDPLERYRCFEAALAAAERVETCESRDWASE